MVDQFQKKAAESAVKDGKLTKHGKELGYMTDLLAVQVVESTSKGVKLAKFEGEVQYMHELFKNYKPDVAAQDQLNLQEITKLKAQLEKQNGDLAAAQARENSARRETDLRSSQVSCLKAEKAEKAQHNFEDYA